MAEGANALAVTAEDKTQVKYLKDYQVPSFLIDSTDLVFDLQSRKTRVESRLAVRRNPDASTQASALQLDGGELVLLSVAIDGRVLDADEYACTADALRIDNVPDAFELLVVTEIDPAKNLSLEGLYLSDGMYCTQCEAEGFRRITYYLDRPDVMSIFSTKIIADAQQFPVLLSNGNRIDSGDADDGRHWVLWRDPFKKPAYLFALVAGDLQCVEDSFTTVSGRHVDLQIFVEAKDLDKCDHAMASLKKAMRWDEEVYGREYDLDLFMIVAVDFFNMGAMENKGLNIFNTSCVLANPKTQTDMAFQRVEGVVAHEYFHNWSGNRVTCRDWFQLSLKEGFTVFRDACFSADMNSATVKRVEDVSLLRSAQFAEDAGPLAHPVRPESFIEISNFYTLTIYEKGAEVIRMMHQLLGEQAFRAGSDLYFQRHDGQAVTCEDFVCAMEDASGADLAQFRRWYSQSGTPVLDVSEAWDQQAGSYQLTFTQSCPPTPGQRDKQPFVIPVALALVGDDGLQALHSDKLDSESAGSLECVLSINEARQQWCFSGLANKPVPSLLRGFSAPVRLNFDYPLSDLLVLMASDTDGFVRWDASQRYALNLIRHHVSGDCSIDSDQAQQQIGQLCGVLSTLLKQGLGDEQAVGSDARWDADIDAALLAELLRLPDYAFIQDQFERIDMAAIHQARTGLMEAMSAQLGDLLLLVYQRLDSQLSAMGEYSPAAEDIALRSLKNTCLAFLMAGEQESPVALARQQFDSADNMTDQSSALSALVNCADSAAAPDAAQCLEQFYQQWSHESLVVNQWLGIQAACDNDTALEKVKALMQHPAYDNTNPNKVRALIGGFCMRNAPQFHAVDGGGYQLLADEVIRLNALNPQLAARMLAPLAQWRRYCAPNSGLMQSALERIAAQRDLSKDVFEVVNKSLADG